MSVIGIHNPGPIAFGDYFAVARWRFLALPERNALWFEMPDVHSLVDNDFPWANHSRNIFISDWRRFHDGGNVRTQRKLSCQFFRSLFRLRFFQLFCQFNWNGCKWKGEMSELVLGSLAKQYAIPPRVNRTTQNASWFFWLNFHLLVSVAKRNYALAVAWTN